MAKSHTVYTCNECSYQTQKWMGKCPQCQSWSSFEESVTSNSDKSSTGKARESSPLFYKDIPEQRIATGMEELDRVFGGGIEMSSLALLSGEPGIGKSTLVLRMCSHISKEHKVLYVSGEESMSQVAMRAKRLELEPHEGFLFVQSNVLEDILLTCDQEKPTLIVLDSIQVTQSQDLPGVAGSISQVRYVTEKLLEYAKTKNITVVIIGHVTKEGNLAGPRVLEHLVDTVLMLEGDRQSHYRLLRTNKNRFGSCDEVGVFEMTGKGLLPVSNPAKAFVEGRNPNSYGSGISSIIEGNRVFLVEIQALTTYTKFGYPKRTSSGYDTNKLHIILAILGKYTKVNLDSYDAYINIAGGLRTRQPSIDLACAASVISSKLQKPLPQDTIILGELGLTGDTRAVFQLEKHLKEAKKLGFTRAVVPKQKVTAPKDMELLPCATIAELIPLLFS